MVGPRVWILVIGLLAFLTAGGEPVKVIGEGCCKEDFDKIYAPLVEAYKGDRKSEAFKKFMTDWVAKRNDMGAKLDDLCGGQIGYKCDGTKDKATCSCNAETGHIAEGNNCMAESEGDMCTDVDPCKAGMHCDGKPLGIGECKEGAATPSPGDGNGVDRTGLNATDEKGCSYTPRPIMWVIIGGLALIPVASS